MAGTQTQQSISGKAIRFVLKDVLFDVLRFPLWWYSAGTMQVVRFTRDELLSVSDRLSIRILFRNLLKPMYGDTSRSGRIISLFMRLLVFVFRLVGLLFWVVILVAAFAAWLLIIPVVVYQLMMQFFG